MPLSPDDRTVRSARFGDSEDGGEPESVERAVKAPCTPSAPPRARVPLEIIEPHVSTLENERFLERAVVGRGGSGIVLRAFDRVMLREVAIKVLDPELADDGSEVDRFAEEARINGQLEHPNIVPVYELGLDRRKRRFLCMKFVEGVTLEEALNRLGDERIEPSHLAKFLQVFVKVCDAVSFAHSRGVIHRDLKPTNVMISDFGQVYVLDWGIARLRPPEAGRGGPRVLVSADRAEQSELDPPGSLVGTAGYMSPEQLHGHHDKLDERTDVFALGATLYQVLTGQPPLTPEIVRAIRMNKSPPPIAPPDRVVPGARVPPELSRIALRALSFDPDDRYSSVVELQRDIEAFQRGAWELPRMALPAGSMVVTEGDAGNAAYVILEGRCVAYRVDGATEVELRVMNPGDVFGETAVFSEKPRTASVKALTDVVLLVVTREVLSNALGLSSWMGAFVKALADRFRELDERLRTIERPARSAGG
jgi:eukaryotic-like serine/threonine-protein kinase